jgi:hypothetical protein
MPSAAAQNILASLGVAGKQRELLTSIWGLSLFPFAVLTIKSGSCRSSWASCSSCPGWPMSCRV